MFLEAARLEWREAKAGDMMLTMPVVAAALILSIWYGHPAGGIAAVGGAVSVGFGLKQRLTRLRATPLILAAFGMAISAWVGATIAKIDLVHTLIVLGIWGYALGAAALISTGLWWILLQSVIALLISFAYPADRTEIIQRVILVLAGGLAQAAVILIYWSWRGRGYWGDGERAKTMPHPGADLSPFSEAGQYAIRVALVLVLGALIAWRWKIGNGYWIPMTAAIVVRPDRHATLLRGITRVAGTLIGAALATGLLAALRPGTATLAALILLAVAGCNLLIRVNYLLFAAAITTYVVFLLALIGLPSSEIAVHRLFATLIGGGLALVTHVAVKHAMPAIKRS
jgi:hypothetical protein